MSPYVVKFYTEETKGSTCCTFVDCATNVVILVVLAVSIGEGGFHDHHSRAVVQEEAEQEALAQLQEDAKLAEEAKTRRARATRERERDQATQRSRSSRGPARPLLEVNEFERGRDAQSTASHIPPRACRVRVNAALGPR